MSNMKKGNNPLLGGTSGFSLSDSFGPQPALLVPAPTPPQQQPQPPPPPPPPPSSGITGPPPPAASTQHQPDPFSSVSLGPPQPPSCSLSPNPSMQALHGSPNATPPLSHAPSTSSLGPPPSGLFLLPSSTSATAPAPPPRPSFTIGGSSIGSGAMGGRKSRYVPPPGINSSAAMPPPLPSTFPTSPSTSALPAMAGVPDSISPPGVTAAPVLPPTAVMHPSNSVPDFSRGTHPQMQDQFNYSMEYSTASHVSPSAAPVPPSSAYVPPTSASNVGGNKPSELVYHWFYKHTETDTVNPAYLNANSQEQQPQQQQPAEKEEVWKPFSMIDSVSIEDTFAENPEHNEPIPTEGGRFDVSIKDRTKSAVFWREEEACPIRRCSWFHQSNVDGRWVPYSEQLASRLEQEFCAGVASGTWSRKLELEDGEYVMFHSSTVMLHFPKSTHSRLDDWGQIQPPADPLQKPRVMHRGLEGLPEIADGDVPGEFDHLVFVVHGIGSVCDMKFRSVVGATNGMRESVNEMSERHFSHAHLAGKATRIEFLPVNWHSTLHGEDTGTDSRLKPLTLRSIPKLRGFVNDTILDVLFYTSPVYCQRILDTVVTEINRMYTLFMARNEGFKGQVSIVGHSLGSLIMFDVLSNQRSSTQEEGNADAAGNPAADSNKDEGAVPTINLDGEESTAAAAASAAATLPLDDGGNESELTLETLFRKLEIEAEHAATFSKEGIDLEMLMTCTDGDLKEAGLPLGPRKRLLSFIERRKSNKDSVDSGAAAATGMMTGLEAYQKAAVTSDVKYTMGPAGTGQPSVKYQQLLFNVSAFYALGSPIGMFVAVRGIESLGANFKFPTCRRFFNIFHPYDPVAYRVEALIEKEYGTKLKPVTIPHHKGRKRMHLELKDTVTKLMTSDLKQKLISTVSAALGSVYNTVTGSAGAADDDEDEQVKHGVEQQMAAASRGQSEAGDDDVNNPTKLNSALNEGNRIDYVLQEAPFETFNEYVFALSSHLCYWQSEDTFLMMLKDIYAQMDVLPDDLIGGMSADHLIGSTPIFDDKPTPTLFNSIQTSSATPTLVNNQLQPPSSTPTLVNNQLQPSSATPTLVNNQLQTSTTPTLVNNQLQPSATPTLVNNQLQPSATPTLVNNQIQSPTPTLVNNSLQSPATGEPSAAAAAAAAISAPPPPPPMMMSPPPPMGPPPPSTSSAASAGGLGGNRRYPKPQPYPNQMPGASGVMGMDPTAPILPGTTPVGPPPSMGFVRKQ